MLRDRMADITAGAYQLAGRLDSPAFVLDFLCWLCRALDPAKVPPGCLNPAMLRGISRAAGISVEKLFAEFGIGYIFGLSLPFFKAPPDIRTSLKDKFYRCPHKI